MKVSAPTVVYFQSTPNRSWPTDVLCNAEEISGTHLHALTTERRDPNTYLGLEARLNTISAGGLGPQGNSRGHWAFGLECPLVLGSWLPL